MITYCRQPPFSCRLSYSSIADCWLRIASLILYKLLEILISIFMLAQLKRPITKQTKAPPQKISPYVVSPSTKDTTPRMISTTAPMMNNISNIAATAEHTLSAAGLTEYLFSVMIIGIMSFYEDKEFGGKKFYLTSMACVAAAAMPRAYLYWGSAPNPVASACYQHKLDN